MPRNVEHIRNPRSGRYGEIAYAIPSHRRHTILGTHTLAMLEKNGVERQDIFIFVSDKNDLSLYRDFYPGFNIILAESANIVEKFNFIHRYFPAGQRVVFVEDDITMLKAKVGENKLEEFHGLQEMARFSFYSCEREGTKIWGISSNANPFYMDMKVSVGFKFIVANLFGFEATGDPFLEISQICKSDYERTLLYYVTYRCVVRNDGICAITKNYQTPGGLQEMSDRAEREEASCRAIVRRFPHLIQINEKKSKISKYMELKLIPQKKNKSLMTDLRAMQKILDSRK